VAPVGDDVVEGLDLFGGLLVAGEFVFISYAHANLGYVRRLATSLERRGCRVWYDERIPTGDLWESLLRQRVVESAAIIVAQLLILWVGRGPE
jgi:TIR domain